jgi:hypothetical protein
MHLRSNQGALKPFHCKALQHAWVQAEHIGYPLNAFITIRSVGDLLSPLDHVARLNKFWNRLGVWSRRATLRAYGEKTFHCILTREAAPNGKKFGVGEHFHALVHVPPAKFNSLNDAIIRWYPAPGEAVVKPAEQDVRQSPQGKIRSALGYLTKQRTPQAAWCTDYSRKLGGVVLGKRYRITANLRAKSQIVAILDPLRRVG